MEECEHGPWEFERLSDGVEYAICRKCLWICNGAVARLRMG